MPVDVTITRTTNHKVVHKNASKVSVDNVFVIVEFEDEGKRYRYPIINVFELYEDKSPYINSKQEIRRKIPNIIEI